MPSGYTAKIADGTMTSLRDYALTCARGMGALVTMRDEPFDAPIPHRLEPDTAYHDEALAEAHAALDRLARAASAELDAMWREDCAAIKARREEAVQRNADIRNRYRAMLDQLDLWYADNDGPVGLHRFMDSQLRESMDFDVSDDPTRYMPEPVESAAEWAQSARESAMHDIEYHAAKREAEIARTAERNAWLDQLWASLPAEEQTP